jgi:drug/metabolite transporter (DMT)-like permease
MVLLAALTHASWHALLKSHGDMLQTIAAVYGAGTLVCALAAPFAPLPSPAAFGFIGASVVLHCASYVYISRAYEASDLSHAFPIYRGLAPVLVAAGAWLLAGEQPSALGMAGLALAAGGVASLAFEGGWPPRSRGLPVAALVLSALLVAAYTIVDGLGVRRSGSPFGYVIWLFLLNGPSVMALAWLVRRRTSVPRNTLQPGRIVIASVLALLSHGLVIWAMSIGSLAVVATLRETAVVFAAIIGSTVLREPFGRHRIAAAIVVATGVTILHAADY